MNSKSTIRWLLITYLPAAVLLGAIAAVSIIFDISTTKFTLDVTILTGTHPFTGMLSNLGILLWCVTASICFFSAMVLRYVQSGEAYKFFLFSSLLSFYLLIDDLFLIHESLAPDYLGVNQLVVLLLLGFAVSSYLIAFRSVILRTNYLLLLLALGMLTLSVVTDVIHEPWLRGLGQWAYFLEDGAKWLGIVGWCSYYSHTSFYALADILPVRRNEHDQSGS